MDENKMTKINELEFRKLLHWLDSEEVDRSLEQLANKKYDIIEQFKESQEISAEILQRKINL